MDIQAKYLEWCKKASDKAIADQLKTMENDQESIKNAFFKDLEFGTGGLRGIIGAGTNCLNIYTISKVTQGLADCMKKYNQTSVSISYDSRINSDLFAQKAASVFASNGIKVYISRELMPTPYLSYMVRTLKTDMGVMITASHNPAKYNGYKVYNSAGCQLTDSAATEMIGYIDKIGPFDVVTDSFDNYIKSGQIEYSDDKIEDMFLTEVKAQSINDCKNLKVVYTPLNGTGYRLVPKILNMVGVSDITIVDEQGHPDGNFTTCPYPNPEKPEALKLGLELAKKQSADILIATDPDADRVGIAVKNGSEYTLMSGNEVGVLLCDYVLSVKKATNKLVENPVVIKTIVTSELAVKVAKKYGAVCENVLTGFKYIGELIGKLESKKQEDRFVLGFEESYGYLAGSYVRDKDAVVAAMLVAQMCSYHKENGKTLVDRINEIYDEFGTYEHKLISYEFPGAEGNAKMKTLLEKLRANLPKILGGTEVTKTIDYLSQTEFDLPKSNVLSFALKDNSQVIVRPSGTEPLIKMYITAAKTKKENAVVFDKIAKDLDKLFK